jgi:hypothetical protein
VEGYASATTVVNRMGQLGYDEEDAFAALSQLAEWQLIQPESLITEKISLDDPVQAHASAYIHMRWFLKKPEYVVAVSADMTYSSYEIAQEAARIWGNQREPGYRMKQSNPKQDLFILVSIFILPRVGIIEDRIQLAQVREAKFPPK